MYDTQFNKEYIGLLLGFSGNLIPMLNKFRLLDSDQLFIFTYWEKIVQRAKYVLNSQVDIVKTIITASLDNNNYVIFNIYVKNKNEKILKVKLNKIEQPLDIPLEINMLLDNELKYILLQGKEVIIKNNFHIESK